MKASAAPRWRWLPAEGTWKYALLLPSPYAFSFGAFVNLHTSLWFGGGGVVASLYNALPARRRKERRTVLPADMSITSRVGGGLIAGDALAALGLGIAAQLSTVLTA